MIIRVQSLIRGWLQRRKYRMKQMTVNVQTKYFKKEESNETLKGFWKAN